MICCRLKTSSVKGRGLARLFSILCVLLAVFCQPAQATDPLRLKDGFRLLDLPPYMRAAENGGHVFSVQNAGSQSLPLIIERLPQNDLAIALGLVPPSRPTLRLFASDDREFAAKPGNPDALAFEVPPNAVQSFYLPSGLAMPKQTGLYLWSPAEHAAHENRRQTFRSSVILLLSPLAVAALISTINRRSRRAAYAVVMGLGLTVLLGSLWMRDILPVSLEFLLADRLNVIRIALGLGVFMSLLAHVNLVIRQILNRNYWTRVIIITDIMLLSAGALCLVQIYIPDFAGLLSAELANMALAITCASVFLGAVFVPDRVGREP